MIKALLLILLAGTILLSSYIFAKTRIPSDTTSAAGMVWWQVQSIDTMKHSRDLAREKSADTSFRQVIEDEVAAIAATGATHLAVGTPYDEEFLPYLKVWVEAARKHGLKVWFRGNWSGWEGWFGYEPIDRQEHIERTVNFVMANKVLFTDGDIFTACTECENGGPGDPRMNNDLAGHRRFLIEEYEASSKAFESIGIRVVTNYNPMNGDVAELVMDKPTTDALGGIVVIDHYVAEPAVLARDIRELSKNSGGFVVLGEFGAPIVDIHGEMSEKEQAEWVASALAELVGIRELVGVNYWTHMGSSTKLWETDGTPRPVQETIRQYYSPHMLQGLIRDDANKPIANVTISNGVKYTKSDDKGSFSFPIFPTGTELTLESAYHQKKIVTVSVDDLSVDIELQRTSDERVRNLRSFIEHIF